MKEVNWEKINQQLRDADWQMKEADLQMREANRQIQQADRQRLLADHQRKDNNPVSEGIAALQRDGLIDYEAGYTIEKKKDKLYINGILQDDAVRRKYDRYFQAEEIKVSGHTNHKSIAITN